MMGQFHLLFSIATAGWLLGWGRGIPVGLDKSGTRLRTRQEGGASPTECGFDGNPDFYGLGIRLGIYLQWIASFLANLFLKRAVAGSLETNSIFLLAVFIALAESSRTSMVQSAEVLVLLHLCFGFILSVLTVWGHRTRSSGGGSGDDPPPRSLLGSVARLALIAMISAYGAWFWWRGLDTLSSGSPECPVYTFILSKQDAFGPLKVFYRIQSFIVLIVYGFLFLREVFLLVGFFFISTSGGAITAAVSLWLSGTHTQREESEDEKMSRRTDQFLDATPLFVKRWFAITSVFFWSGANRELSVGMGRPTVEEAFRYVDIFIFLGRSAVQILCLALFRWSPPIGFPPLLSVIYSGYRRNVDLLKRKTKHAPRPETPSMRRMFGVGKKWISSPCPRFVGCISN